MVEFFKTRMGITFFQSHVPEFVRQFKALNDNIKALADALNAQNSVHAAVGPDGTGVRVFADKESAEAFMDEGAVDDGWMLFNGLVVE
jgi:hypothetical protein